MIIRDDMVCSTIILAMHPNGKGLAASTVKTKLRERSPEPLIGSWNYTLGGHNEFKKDGNWENPLECIQRECLEEGWKIPEDSNLREVYRGMRPVFHFTDEKPKNHYWFYSVTTCDKPLILLDDYPEKNEGVEQTFMVPDEFPLVWQSKDSYIVRLLANNIMNRRKISSINLTDKGWEF